MNPLKNVDVPCERQQSLNEIAAKLIQGQVGIFPCDTIWGILGIIDKKIVSRIYDLKQRSLFLPLLLLIPDFKTLSSIANPLSTKQSNLINQHWPGPVTVILKKLPTVPNFVTGGKDTIGIRLPNFEPLNYLLKKVNQPLVSTSANISTTPPPRSFSDISSKIINQVDFVFNKFEPGTGKESTVVDYSSQQAKVLRGNL